MANQREYDELEEAVEELVLVSDWEGVADLITPDNVRLVRDCSPHPIEAEDFLNVKRLEEMYLKGLAVYGRITTVMSAREALEYFNSTNVGALSVWRAGRDVLGSYGGLTGVSVRDRYAQLDALGQNKISREC